MMKILRACYDWRVITGLAAVGVGVFLVAPNVVGAALPLLVVAACPLSMMLMMRTMGSQEATARSVAVNPDDLEAQLAASRHEQERLTRELERLRGESAVAGPAKARSLPAA